MALFLDMDGKIASVLHPLDWFFVHRSPLIKPGGSPMAQVGPLVAERALLLPF